MEIKVISSYSEDNWYSDQIGNTFFVADIDKESDFLYVPIPFEGMNKITPLFILKKDCEVICG